MSLVEKVEQPREVEPEPGSLEDPFRLGWRNVTRTLPDGEVEYDQIPLTPEDLLFPEEYDHAMHHPAHAEDCYYLYGCLKILVDNLPRPLILTDCRVDFDIPGVRPLGPDVAVFQDADEGWSAAPLKLSEIAARPVLVAEVTSPETRDQDFDRKRDFYHRANVPFYAIVDSQYRKGIRSEVKLVCFRHTPDGYEPIPPDDQGRVWVEPLGFWLKIEDNRLACIDGQTGRPIEAFAGQAQARKAAEARAEIAEAQSQAEIKARIEAEAQSQAEIKARIEAEARSQADVKARIEAESRAQTEVDARVGLEVQMLALQEELRRLQGQG